VTFSHRAQGRTDSTKRELEPWGVVNRRGRWYVAGWDRSRQATRVFRLSRIDGPVKMAGPAGSVTVPTEVDVRELVRDWDVAPSRDRTAVLRVRDNAGHGLRRYARAVEPDAAGWDRVTVQFADVPWYADYLASFGPDVAVLDPPDLRDAVKARLKGVLA
jgi:proteasome accessory factor B